MSAFRIEPSSVELARINADGSVVYNWPEIKQRAALWQPGNTDMLTCLAFLLLPFAPEA